MDETYWKLLGTWILSILAGMSLPIGDLIWNATISTFWKIALMIFYISTLATVEEIIRRHFKISKEEIPPIPIPSIPIIDSPIEESPIVPTTTATPAPEPPTTAVPPS